MAILNRDKKKDDKKASDKAKTSKAKKPAKKKEEKKFQPKVFSNAYRVLKHPVISEKAAALETEGKYVFKVTMQSTKEEVIKAIKSVYGVAPAKVNIIKMHKKPKRFAGKPGRQNQYKKAIVTLPKGKTIDVYEGV